MLPTVVAAGIVLSTMLDTENDATEPEADTDMEEPAPVVAPTAMLPVLVMAGEAASEPLLAVWVTLPKVPAVATSLLVVTDNEATAPVALTDADAPWPRVVTVTDDVSVTPFFTSIVFKADCVTAPNVGTVKFAAVADESVRPDTDTDATAPEALTEADAPSPKLEAVNVPELLTLLVVSVVLLTVWFTVPKVKPDRLALTMEVLTEATAPVALMEADAPTPKTPTLKPESTPTLVMVPVF